MNGGDRGETEHFGEALRRRTKAFALDVLEFCRGLPKTDEAMVIGRQLLRSGMAVGANYRAASRARSAAEFVSKISIVVEEADETLYWLETLLEASIATRSRVASTPARSSPHSRHNDTKCSKAASTIIFTNHIASRSFRFCRR